MEKICPRCHMAVLDSYYFCPNCGKKIKSPPASTTVYSQIKIYAVSILLPPVGLVPGIKYLIGQNSKAKIIGIVAIVLTIVSTIVTVWFSARFIVDINNRINTQLQQYRDLGL